MTNEQMGWDADFYKTLSDTTRNVSLSDKEIYVLGNLLPMVSWVNRWSGDLTGLDIDAIRGDMEFTILDEVAGGTMSCPDVANCIDTDATVQTAITETIQNNGYSPDINISETEPTPIMTAADKALDLLPDSLAADCAGQPQLAMGLARTIVRELHESAEDTLELFEYATNTLEAWANVSSSLPSAMANVITIALDWIDWILEIFKELYEAAYTQSVEDELSCAIFCHIMDNCSLSLSDLQTIFAAESAISTPPSGLIETLEFIYTIATSADKIAVAAFYYQIVSLLQWGKFAALTPVYIKSLLASTQGSDYSFEDLCDDCPISDTPTIYWALHFDFRISKHGTDVVIVNGGGNDGRFENGYRANLGVVASTTNANFGYPDLGASYNIKGQATRSVRRGSSGNGTHDFATLTAYPNANYGGTSGGGFTFNFINEDGNAVTVSAGSAASTLMARSFHIRTRLNKATNASPTPELRTYEVVVIGLPDGLGNKPPRSYWFGDTFPTSHAMYFPDYVAP